MGLSRAGFWQGIFDRTINDLLALPISRSIILLSKFIVTVLWCLILSMYVLILELITGMVVDMPEWSLSAMIEGISVFAFAPYLQYYCLHRWFYLQLLDADICLRVIFMIFTIALAQIIAFIGYGHLFPWSIPPLQAALPEMMMR